MAMELPRVVFFGRSGSDALQFFDLDLADWRGARILDCPGGPGSLVATARRNGVEAVAVDPLYALPSPEIEQRCLEDLDLSLERIAQSDALRADFDLAAYRRSKLIALEEFLADRLAHPSRVLPDSQPSQPAVRCWQLRSGGLRSHSHRGTAADSAAAAVGRQLTTTAYDQGFEGATPLLLLERGGPDRT